LNKPTATTETLTITNIKKSANIATMVLCTFNFPRFYY
jgi:hypothetical protein